MLTRIGARVRILLAAALCVTAGACAVNPVTGRPQLALISEAQEIQIGREAAQQVEQSIGLVPNGPLQAYVQRLGDRLAAVSQRPKLPWTFRVVDDPTPNAFALPGGFIFVTRGMMNLMDTESELATVLGHEIAHVTARHSVTQISRQQLAQIGLGIGGVFLPELQQFGNVAGAGFQLLFLKYGRDAERQADELGFDYANELGYDVREMADVFRALQVIGEGEGRSPLPSWLATHPYPAERIRDVEERVAALQQPLDRATLGRAEYLGMIDGLVYGVNPRNGFFRENVFLHPDLAFRIAFPTGWQAQNLAQAVVAASPRQDAAIQLTLAGTGTPSDAAQRFLAQPGVQRGRVLRETINGLPAVIAYFSAQTQQGQVINGLAAFVEYGGRVYQIISYAPRGAFDSYDRLFRQVVGSFAPLTDPQVLAIRPQRLDIVRLERNMTLGEFSRLFPSVIPNRELVTINQVADETSLLAAGTLVKRVIQGEIETR